MRTSVTFWAFLFSVSCSETSFKSGSQSGRSPVAQSSAVPSSLPAAGVQTEKIQLTPGAKTLGKSDVVFLVDTSGSMKGEMRSLETSMASFLQSFQQSMQGDAIQVYVVGSGFKFPPQTGGVTFKTISDSIGSHSALDVLLRLIKASTFRPDARIDAVVISDDNASMSAVSFKSQIIALSLSQGLRLHSIVGLSNGGGIAAVGSTYIALSDDQAHNGAKLDIRSTNWNGLLGELASKIMTTNSQTQYRLQFAPDLTKQVTISINGVTKSPQEVRLLEDGSVQILAQELQSITGAMDISYYRK